MRSYIKSNKNMIDIINLIKSFLGANATYKDGADYYELTRLFAHLQNLIMYDQDTLFEFRERGRVYNGEITYEQMLQKKWAKK
jgi:hypothetical protein